MWGIGDLPGVGMHAPEIVLELVQSLVDLLARFHAFRRTPKGLKPQTFMILTPNISIYRSWRCCIIGAKTPRCLRMQARQDCTPTARQNGEAWQCPGNHCCCVCPEERPLAACLLACWMLSSGCCCWVVRVLTLPGMWWGEHPTDPVTRVKNRQQVS